MTYPGRAPILRTKSVTKKQISMYSQKTFRVVVPKSMIDLDKDHTALSRESADLNQSF